ncbi:MAG: tautomerase family protein [Campylobacterales bacterium]|uniref:tautomerase family protein n=1 Tax=Acinetobacter junii TaxID=40215 RepID=UPI000F6825D3|nr:tautomerase family protein [Acinetobacter junii]MBD3843035.1 tautomerase family protein [Campylobacterales bacterium]MBJ8441100.1 tautomerase family protein [Acinetobacter junii]RSE33293.1 tautomerase family protein [Acinetobacter junii]
MPSVLIEVRQKYTLEVELGIIEAVHSALIEAFRIMPNDRHLRLVTYEAHHFQCPPDKEKPEFFTHITIDCFVGRSLETKRLLYKTIVDNLEPFGVPRDHVMIIIREISTDNFGIRGGQAASDIDLGFKIDV